MKPKVRSAPRRRLIRRKRLARRPARVNVNRALQPVPQRYICKLKYSDIVVTSAGSGMAYLNLNSLFDPNRTGFGHQPYAYDTLSTLYNRYRVISCGWRLHVVHGATDAPTTTACQPANEELLPTSMSEIRENPRAKYVVAQPGGGIQYLTGKTYLPSLVGRTKSQYMSDDRYQAQVTASPQELAILNIATASGADSFVSRSVNILMEFTVEFFDQKHLGQS